jgi:6-phosphogluconolactonase
MIRVYIGTYTGAKSRGIYLSQLDPATGKLAAAELAAEVKNPSFLAIHPSRKFVYAVSEVADAGGKPTGGVSAFAVEPATGKLKLLNQQSSQGAGPCHLALDQTGKYLLVANDKGGSVAVLPVGPDGKLGEATDVKQHSGSSVHPERQKEPHPSGAAFSPDNKFAFVCDVGLDKIFVYRFDAESGKLTPHEQAFTPTKPGAGPRRLVFRPDGKFAYVVNELDSTVTALAYDPAAGTLKELQTLSTLPGYYDGPNTAVEIGVHPSGKNLLVSNCGNHSVVLFTIDDSGQLTYVEDQSTYGTNPRHFGIASDGKHVVVANQDSGSILILRSPENARVKPGGNVTKTPSPTCAKFLTK